MDASELLSDARIVPVVVIDDVDTAVDLAITLAEAGLPFVEVTLRTPAALKAIECIAENVPEVIVGAGSVRRVSQVGDVVSAGARFAVSPGYTDELVVATADQNVPFIPGAVTPGESLRLLEHGYRLQKFFPAELAGGRPMLKAMGAPLPEVRYCPTGGINAELAAEYLAMDNVACVGGSWIAPAALLRARDFAAIGRLARDAARLTV